MGKRTRCWPRWHRWRLAFPLDAAALGGHSSVVRELINHCGIKVCAGESGGVGALYGWPLCSISMMWTS